MLPTNQPIKAIPSPKIASEDTPVINVADIAGHGEQANTVRTSATTVIRAAAADDNVLEIPASTLDIGMTCGAHVVEVTWTNSGEFTGFLYTPCPDWLTTPTSTLPYQMATSPALTPMNVHQVPSGDSEAPTDGSFASQDMPNQEALTEYMGITWDDNSR
ncbi:hypothetical protein PIIN_08351 [Serendipita indica DSM 11827]|uniref:Uncharacterized protein n=1 Tax=Serendipita indica (strain DSM 11827) TaxID=1109443 RepID=G4TSV6_SERID|nr:hypothetical protein PIIN_08351 [Serendipita indica DSM 11827]